MSYTYLPGLVLLEGSDTPIAAGTTGVLRDAAGETVAIADLNGSALGKITVGSMGVHQGFLAETPDGVLDFGDVLLPVSSVEVSRAGIQALTTARAAQTNAQAALVLLAALASGGPGVPLVVKYGENVDATELQDGTLVIDLSQAGATPGFYGITYPATY